MENEIIQLKKELADLTLKFNHLHDLYFRTKMVDKDMFINPIVGGASGLRLGDTKGKIGVYGVNPVVRAATITTPTGGATIDSQARSSIGEIKTVLTNFGITL